jgi:hypothetical protein
MMSYRTFLCIMLLVMLAGCSEHKPAGPPKSPAATEPGASESTAPGTPATADPKK